MSPPRRQTGLSRPLHFGHPLAHGRAFAAHSYCEPRHEFVWHFHADWEIVFIRSGCGTRHVGSSVESFGPGDLAMLPANVPHTYFSSAGQVGESRGSVIHFQPGLWGGLWQLPELEALRGLCAQAQHGLVFSGPGVADVGCRIERLAAASEPSLTSFATLLGIFASLGKLAAHSLHADEAGEGVRSNPRLDELLAWIGRSLAQPITQRQAAAKLKMTPSAFSRWFKSHTGCVFQHYLNRMRISRVCLHLAGDDTPITSIAFALGFNNLANFNRHFQKIIGLTPTAFRKRSRMGFPPATPTSEATGNGQSASLRRTRPPPTSAAVCS